jgi:rare lipoprotein A
MGMTNNITYPIQNMPISINSAKRKVGSGIRKAVAIALFSLTTLMTVGGNLNLALANKLRQVKSGGQFRLLNIYNSLKASNPTLINAMNNAKQGLASWYGGMFHGRKTAMGTIYNMNAMTAAHRTLPLGTWVKVTNDQNGKSAIVQVTDRGPYVANRIMDLSAAAATKLGYKNAGTTHISMQVLGSNPNAEEASLAPAMDVKQDAIMTDHAQQTADSTRVASIIPAMFDGVKTRTENTTIDAEADVASLISTITTLASGTPVAAVANVFA